MNIDAVQKQVAGWGVKCFGTEQMSDRRIRALRLLEEVLEYAQASGVTMTHAFELGSYVYSRPVGDPYQELGGVGVTALAAAESMGGLFSAALATEVARILSKTPEHFTARNQNKVDLGFA